MFLDVDFDSISFLSFLCPICRSSVECEALRSRIHWILQVIRPLEKENFVWGFRSTKNVFASPVTNLSGKCFSFYEFSFSILGFRIFCTKKIPFSSFQKNTLIVDITYTYISEKHDSYESTKKYSTGLTISSFHYTFVLLVDR